jgi:DNA mismatch repair protein MutS
MRQYARFKQKHPDCVLIFRMGDFYEMFYDDAVRASKALGLTLTQRTEGVPMAGVPYHQKETYLRRMLAAGFRVAVCEQIQDPAEAKGVVARAVTQVLTPGTLVDDDLVTPDAVRTLAAGFLDRDRAALAIVDAGSGAFHLAESDARGVGDLLARFGVGELLLPDADDPAIASVESAAQASGVSLTRRPAWQFRAAEACEALREQFGVASLGAFGLREDEPAARAAGAVVRYLRETQTPMSEDDRRQWGALPATLAHLRPPRRDDPAGRCVLDAVSLRSLEIERTMRDGQSDGSLVGLFAGACRSAMGRRALRDWLCMPLADADAIGARHAAVTGLVDDRRLAGELGPVLEDSADLPRIAGRLALGRATPRDVVALGRTLERVPALLDLIEPVAGLRAVHDALAPLRAGLGALGGSITTRCVDAPPAHLREGGLFRDGVDDELDECRTLQRDAGAWLSAYQARLASELDLPSLKVGYNRVFGYYIELPAAQARRAPEQLIRKQTLKNAERYITPELGEFERKVTTAEARSLAREQQMFAALCAQCAAQLDEVQRAGDALATLDALLAFADRAHARGWVRPEIVADAERCVLEITQGRHPVLEASLADRFVPNDLSLGSVGDSAGTLALITGPNMAGKSTFIRQVALVTLLAQAGSFVPAERARLSVADRICTRVGADDALHRGQSTFMVEMTETASILHHATDRSLVILDEIGRGTSTLDGLSLAWAIAEHVATIGARSLFATHYHELTELAERLPGRVTNLHVAVREWTGRSGESEVVFLHRILPGRTDKSYGIHVARLAGLPDGVVRRAREVLEALEREHAGAARAASAAPPALRSNAGASQRDQLSLFTEYVPHPALARLREVKLEALSPLQAFDLLRELRAEAEPGV